MTTASSKQRFHDVNEPTEPQWSFSLFKNNRISDGVNLQFRLEAFNVFNVRVYGGPNTNPTSGELRRRRHREPGELPTDAADWRAGGILDRRESEPGIGDRGTGAAASSR